jgi:spermidine synthase
LVFKSAHYGNVLVLDGVIQMTERDEFAYHEMMVHLPLCSHEKPKRVLIVGGGDGGVLREVCRHGVVEHITVVEIDPVVIDVATTYFGALFDDSRVTIVNADAADFLKRHSDDHRYDIILGDTSDPVGPAESLFQPAFYESMVACLNDRGIVCVQAECFWIHLDLISDLMACCLDIGFTSAEYATTMVPTYICGQIGFLLASKGRHSCQQPVRTPSFVPEGQLKWYSAEMHVAAFTLPPFVKRRLAQEFQQDLIAAADYSIVPAAESDGVLINGESGNISRGVHDDDYGHYNDNQEQQQDDGQNNCFLDGFLKIFQLWSLKKLFEDCTDKVGEDDDDDNDNDGAYVTDDDDDVSTS